MPGGMPAKLVHFAFTFHLPVFFVASGYFFKLDTVLDKQFFKKSWKNLLVPYIVTSAIIILGCVFVAFAHDASMKAELFRWLGAAAYGAGASAPTMLLPVERIGGIWFLLAMFWAQVFVLVAQRLPKPTLWLAGWFVLGWLSAYYVQLPWSIQAGMCASIYIYAGAIAKKFNFFERSGWKANALLTLCAAIWFIYVVGPFDHMSFSQFVLPSGLFDVVGTFASAYTVIHFCRFLEHHIGKLSTFMEWIGRNTLVIFCLHIVEDNTANIYWQQLIATCGQLFPHFGWVVFLAIRLAFDALLCGIVYCIPKLNAVYFPSKKKKITAAPKTVPSEK